MALSLIISMVQLSLLWSFEISPADSAGTCFMPTNPGIEDVSEAINATANTKASRTLLLPKLVTKGFVTEQQLCNDARKNYPEKKLLLVAVKSHMCDSEVKVCLRATRDLSDPCNRFMRDNFAMYHTRNFRTSPDHKHNFEEDPAIEQIEKIWGSSGPSLVIMDIQTCKRIGMIGPGLAGLAGPNSPPAITRFRMLQNQVLEIPGVREKLPAKAGAALTQKELKCFQTAEPTLDQTWQALENAQP